MSVLKVYACSYPAILIPKIGNGEESKIHELKTAYEKMAEEISNLEPNTIVFVSPMAPTMSDKFYISSIGQAFFSFKRLGHREINLSCRYDDFFTDQLKRACSRANLDSFSLACYDGELDEATAVPLWFIQKKYKDFNVVRVGLSMLSFKKHEDLGKQISKIADFLGKRVVVVALGQLANHRVDKESNRSLPEAARFDAELCRIFKFAELAKLKYLDPKFCLTASATDIRSFIVAAGVLSAFEYSSSALEYTASFGHGNVFSSFDINKSQIDKMVDEVETEFVPDTYTDTVAEGKTKINFDKSHLSKGEALEAFNQSYVNAESKSKFSLTKESDDLTSAKFGDFRDNLAEGKVAKAEDKVELKRDYSPLVDSLVKTVDSRSEYEKKFFAQKSISKETKLNESSTAEHNDDKNVFDKNLAKSDKNLELTSNSKKEFGKPIDEDNSSLNADIQEIVVEQNEQIKIKTEEALSAETIEGLSEDNSKDINEDNVAVSSKIELVDNSSVKNLENTNRVKNRRKVKNVYKLPLKSDPYVELAIFAIRYFVQYGKMAPLPNNVPEKILNRKSACFISVYLHEQLMGCIGTLNPKHDNLAEEIVYNALAACKNDQRFRLKSMTDARQLRATVDILGETEAVYNLAQLDPSQYGIVVYKGERKALLLPRLAGVNTIEQQLGIAATKAGVDVRKIERVDRFAVERHI